MTPNDDRPRRLRIAPEAGAGPGERRADMADLLGRLADISGSGTPWALGDHECDPIAALVITAFSDAGEPVFITVGVDEAMRDSAAWDEVRHDIELGLWELRRGGHQAVRAGWLRTDNIRRRQALRRRIEEEQRARTHPFPCDYCGQRCKTSRGLTLHQRACPRAKRAARGT